MMIGERVGSYRILRELGQGGMGVVYLAQHEVIGRRVALKVLLPEHSRSAEMVARIFNEARAAAMIEHPGLVDVYDFGTHTDGSAYLVMEYLEGESLGTCLKRERRLPVDAAVGLARQIASAVGAAHDKGIVHRDLKPDNVFLSRDDEVAGGLRARVLDFGIAKLAAPDATGGPKTRTGALFGTPIYMSPEQCRGAGAVDHRSDIYSLGCIVFEMLCGRPPFVRDGAGELIAAHLYEPSPSPSSLAPSVPAFLDVLVVRMLAKDVSRRFASMAEVLATLDLGKSQRHQRLPTPILGARVAGSAGGTMRLPPSDEAGAPGGGEAPPPPAGGQTTFSRAVGQVTEARAPARSGRRKAVVAVAAAAVTVAMGALLLGRAGPPAAPKPPVAATPPEVKAPPSEPVPAPVAPPPPLAAPDRVTLRIASEPPGAAVYLPITGVRLGTTPLEHKIPPSPGTVEILLKLAGYQDAKVEMSAERAASETFALKKSKGPPRGPGKGRGKTDEAAGAAKAPPGKTAPSKPAIKDGALDPFGSE